MSSRCQGVGDIWSPPTGQLTGQSDLVKPGERVAFDIDPAAPHVVSGPKNNRTNQREHNHDKVIREDNAPISPKQFADELMRYKRGSVTRRHFLGVTGLGLATAVLGARARHRSTSPPSRQNLGTKMSLATWPNYHDPATFEAFTAETGVAVEVNVFGSNEEMLAKLQAGGAGWDLFVPTNYTISTYEKLGLIDELDLSKLPNFSARDAEPALHHAKARSTARPMPCRRTGARPAWRSTPPRSRRPITSWKEFFDVAMGEADGRAMVHDYQLTTIGNALVSLGYSASTRSSPTNWPRPRNC